MTLEEGKSELRKMAPKFAQKVAPLYVILNWQWSPGKTQPHVPSVDEIEKTLFELIDGLQEGSHGAGGLEASYDSPDEEGGELGRYGLRFTIENSEAFD